MEKVGGWKSEKLGAKDGSKHHTRRRKRIRIIGRIRKYLKYWLPHKSQNKKESGAQTMLKIQVDI